MKMHICRLNMDEAHVYMHSCSISHVSHTRTHARTHTRGRGCKPARAWPALDGQIECACGAESQAFVTFYF